MEESIQQELVFEGTPAQIYEALTNADRFREMCGGAPTEIDAQPGGAFSCFGGMITGRQIECVPALRLVQAWRAKNWAPGSYSIARFELQPDGKATRLTFTHTGFPDGQRHHLEDGWHANYWEPLKRWLA